MSLVGMKMVVYSVGEWTGGDDWVGDDSGDDCDPWGDDSNGDGCGHGDGGSGSCKGSDNGGSDGICDGGAVDSGEVVVLMEGE